MHTGISQQSPLLILNFSASVLTVFINVPVLWHRWVFVTSLCKNFLAGLDEGHRADQQFQGDTFLEPRPPRGAAK